jgi:hypothetical protein
MRIVRCGETYEAKTGDVVTVEDGGVCRMSDDSKPVVTVEDGGVCSTSKTIKQEEKK